MNMPYSIDELQDISIPVFDDMFTDYLIDQKVNQRPPNIGGFVNGVLTKEHLERYYSGPYVAEVLEYMNENETRHVKAAITRQDKFRDTITELKQIVNLRYGKIQQAPPIKQPIKKKAWWRQFFI